MLSSKCRRLGCKGFGIIDILMLVVVFMFLTTLLSKLVAPTITTYYPDLAESFPDAAEFLKLTPLMFVLAFFAYIFVRASGIGGGGNG